MTENIPWTRLATNNPPRLVDPLRDEMASDKMTRVMAGRVIEMVDVKDASEVAGVVFGWVTLTFTDGSTLEFKVSGIEAVMDVTVTK